MNKSCFSQQKIFNFFFVSDQDTLNAHSKEAAALRSQILSKDSLGKTLINFKSCLYFAIFIHCASARGCGW